ncbi:BadF/BadG/BcrA/BcrD ATPase family protein [Thalassotalea ponticola]|uniref:BadF/BadG/BcrA/BcrD ATPase family protein n=1 Tax=Thalassotalea ponticola TaxID=1523392 RepID=UPI0025B5D2BB|nr:BadF/BadG/BcrA/BcrD ATPase family protein [Thalassotalea ponticola]MDN3653232.1 BadF/BadG/BcrA/BcrD ATPase family protein [Thalassotalea ponticola]
MTAKQQLFVGIDGGGTKCKAIVVNNHGQILGHGVAGPANAFQHLTLAQQSIIDATVLALDDAGLSHMSLTSLVVGAGLAGVNIDASRQAMLNWQHPFAQFYLTTDMAIACLGAHQAEPGAIIICGTGSAGYAHNGIRELHLGGHGFAHGDICSGAWFGLRAVEQVLLSSDGFQPATQLQQCLFDQLKVANINQLIAKSAGQGAGFYGQLAKQVFFCAEQGDQLAMNIVEQGLSYFCQMVDALTDFQQGKIALIGGLVPLLTPHLPNRVKTVLSRPQRPPEYGAILFAQRQYVDEG